MAAGFYKTASGAWHGLLLTGSGSSWTATTPPLPANAETKKYSYLDSLACGLLSGCSATGQYTDTSGQQQGLLLTRSGSSWTATEAPLPPNAQSGPYMATVTCAPAGPCVAAGDYADTSGHQQGLLLTGSGSSWTAAKAPVPANASADPVTSPESAACASPTECFVAGEYDGPSSDSQPLLETWSGSSWAGSEAPLPADAQDQGANLDSVICASVSECFVVGEYDGPSGGQPLVLTWSGGTWAAAGPPLPANAASTSQVAPLISAACPSAAECVAVGWYIDTSDHWQALLDRWPGSSWTATEAPLPPNAATNPGATFESVACASASECVAVGSYTDASGGRQGMLVTEPG